MKNSRQNEVKFKHVVDSYKYQYYNGGRPTGRKFDQRIL
jgi:hypothetical protein